MKVRWLAAILMSTFAAVASAQTGQVPTGETALGSVRIPRSVKADGKDLKAGTYQVRLTAQAASPAVPGQTMERWVEFVQGGKVVGREVVSIVPASEALPVFVKLLMGSMTIALGSNPSTSLWRCARCISNP